MSARLPFGGGYYVADTSAWQRAANDPTLALEWQQAFRNNQIAICAPVKMELLYVAQTAADFMRVEETLSELQDLPVNRGVINTAITALRELAQIQDRYHRVNLPDALIAAAAAERGFGVLHCDGHYERLKRVLTLDTRWIC